MKKTIFLIIFLSVSATLFCQIESTSKCQYDSVYVSYFAWCEGIENKIVVKKDSICFYKVTDNKFRNNKYALIHTITNRKTIEQYNYNLDIICNNDPVYNNQDGIIDDCGHWMKFTYFNKTELIEKNYYLNDDALLPFAFTELYCLIIPVISKDVNEFHSSGM